MINKTTRTKRRGTRIGVLAGAVAAGAALTGALAPPPAYADADAKYVVSVTSIRAVDESGPDWAGSDETYGGYQATDPRNGAFIAGFRTQFFTSFDTGDTKFLDSDKQCLPTRQVLARRSGRTTFYDARGGDRWTCNPTSTSPGGISAPFTITGQLYDQEGCASLFSAECHEGRNQVLGRWLDGDQSVGKGTLALSAAGLAADLPSVGSTRSYEMTHKANGAHYKSLVTIQRVG